MESAEYAHLTGTFLPRSAPVAAPASGDRMLPIGAGIEPFYGVPELGPLPAPQFYPAQTPIKDENAGPAKPGDLIYRWANGTRAYSLALDARQLGGQNWVEEIPLRYAIWSRDMLVKFVSDVAGVCGAKTPGELMLDPFSDLKAVLRTARPRPGDMQMPRADAADTSGLSGVLRPPGAYEPSETNFRTHGYTEAMKTLELLANTVLRFGNGSDVLRVYDYLQNRTASRDAAIVQWLTLPMNLGRVFLTSEMQSAVQIALSAVSEVTGEIDSGDLFSEVLSSESYIPFFQLVGTQVLLQRYDRRAGAKTRHEREHLQQRFVELQVRIRAIGLGSRAGPLLVPPDQDLSAQAFQQQGSRPQTDAAGRQIVWLN